MGRLVGFIIAWGFTWFTAETALQAGQYPDSAQIALTLAAQEYLLDDNYAAADSIYVEQIASHPHDPSGYLFRAGGLLAEMSDTEENLYPDLFEHLLDTVDLMTDSIGDTCSPAQAAWMHLYRGHALAYRSLWESHFGSSFTALKIGLSTDDEYYAGLAADSTLLDIYAGLGSFHFWKSAKAGLLRTIGLFKNEKKKGIAELRLAADSSLIHRKPARSSLIWIWLEEKQYDSAVALASEFATAYPNSRTFLWPMAQARFKQKSYSEAVTLFRRLRQLVTRQVGNYYNLIECDYYLTESFRRLSEPDSAVAASARLLEYKNQIPPKTYDRQRTKINYLKRTATP